MIYKDKLEDLPLSIEAFEELERRFPDNSHRLESYYQVYLMALRTGNTSLAAEYKTKMINAFPNEDYTIAISDPNYEYNIRMMDSVQDSIYQQTYNSYLASDTVTVRRNFRDVSVKYPLATLMPKFMFLDALTYVQAGDAEGFKTALKALVEKYPTADVTELAGEMLKGILRGRTLMQGSVTGMTWNLRFGLGEDGSLSAADSARTFTAEPNTPYRMILMYPTGSVDKNQLLFAVAAYNFANFMVKEFDLAFEEAGPMSMLNISGFTGIEEILQYYKMIYGKDGYAQALDKNVAILPISEDNYETLMRGKTLEEYINFFEENFGGKAPELATRWNNRMLVEEEKVKEAETESELPGEDQPDETVQPEDESPAKEIKSVRRKEAEEEKKEEAEKPVEQVAPKDTVIPEISVPDTVANVPAIEVPVDTVSVQPAVSDTVAVASPQDTVPAVQAPEERKELTLKEIEAIRKREAAAEEARKEADRKAFEAQQKAEKELQEQKAKERADLLKKQEEEEKALLKAKADREKQLEQDRKNKLKQAEADRKAKQKAREELRKQKEREYKERLKQKEKERKQKEKQYKETLKAKEKARREAQKAKEAARKR